jgi:hypothetical protein
MLGGRHFFVKNRLVPLLTSCYENLIGSLIYIFWLVKTNHIIKIFKFSKFTQFSNKAVLAYKIIVDFQNWLSHFLEIKS